MAMSWPEEERAQNEHIERALQECGLFGSVSGFHDSRDPTFSRVDARPSVKLAGLVCARRHADRGLGVRVSSSCPFRQTGEQGVIDARKRAFAHHVPLIVSPTADHRLANTPDPPRAEASAV